MSTNGPIEHSEKSLLELASLIGGMVEEGKTPPKNEHGQYELRPDVLLEMPLPTMPW